MWLIGYLQQDSVPDPFLCRKNRLLFFPSGVCVAREMRGYWEHLPFCSRGLEKELWGWWDQIEAERAVNRGTREQNCGWLWNIVLSFHSGINILCKQFLILYCVAYDRLTACKRVVTHMYVGSIRLIAGYGNTGDGISLQTEQNSSDRSTKELDIKFNWINTSTSFPNISSRIDLFVMILITKMYIWHFS